MKANGTLAIPNGNRLNSSGILAPASGLARTTLPFLGTLQAAGTVGDKTSVPIAGTSFYLYSTTGPLTIQPNGGSAITYDQGTGLGPSDIPFINLQISNPNNFAVTFELVVGFTELIDKRLILAISGLTTSIPVRNALTLTKGYRFSLGAGATQDFPGTALGTKPRKQIVFYNESGSANLFVLDNGGTVMGVVVFGQSWTIETSDDIKINNPNGGAITVDAGETYYNQ